MSRLSFSLRACLVLVLWAGAGCGGSKVPLAPVHGKVTVDGQPLTSGQVSLIPEGATGQPDLSGGTIENGEYKIFTGGREGAPLGKYKVTVNMATVPTGGGGAPALAFARKYMDPKGSPLKIEVVNDPASGAYDLPLKK